MRSVRMFIAVLLVALSSHLAQGVANAQQPANNTPPDAPFAGEFKEFFDEVAAAFKKHPDAAKRFTIFDRVSYRKTDPNAPIFSPRACIPTCTHVCAGGGTVYCCGCGINIGEIEK